MFNAIVVLSFLILLGLTESIYVSHKDEYTEFEQASLRQLHQSKVKILHLQIVIFLSIVLGNTDPLGRWLN
jgi:hypothetical protein